MIAYVGQTRGKKLTRELIRHGIGECTLPVEWPPRRVPYFLDNGAFPAWTANEPWDRCAFEEVLGLVEGYEAQPDFVVAPDVVAGGHVSLELSLEWLPRLGPPAYLAVQDGMEESRVREALTEGFAGVFVGGTLEWKLATGARWVEFAHELGLRCHIGRVGTADRVQWAAEIGADSIDSSLPLWSAENLRRFTEALEVSRAQVPLFHRRDA